VAVQVQVKFCVAPAVMVAVAGLAEVQLLFAVGLRVGATELTEALDVPLFLTASVRVTAWPVLAVAVDGVSVGASAAAVWTVTFVPVTVGLTFAPLTESVAATVAP
jgi:hypothetical protein